MRLDVSLAIATESARGIGKKISETLAEQGVYVAIVDILNNELKRTAEEISKIYGKVLPIVCDITQVDQVNEMVNKVPNELGSMIY